MPLHPDLNARPVAEAEFPVVDSNCSRPFRRGEDVVQVSAVRR